MSLTGSAAGNYTLTQPTLSANITALPTTLTFSSSENPSVYGDHVILTATVTPASVTGNVLLLVGGFTYGNSPLVSGSTSFDTGYTNASPQTISISAAYVSGTGNILNSTNTISQTINPKPLTVLGTLALTGKVYDGTTAATPTGVAALQSAELVTAGSSGDGKPFIGDVVGLTGTAASYAFNSATVAGATIVTGSGLSLTGGQAGNYTLTAPVLTASISPKPLTAQGTLSGGGKTYDGTTTATPAGTAALQVAETPGTGNSSDGKPYTSDSVSLAGTASYAFNSSAVATATTITASGLSLTGGQAGNYSLTLPTLSANISKATSSVSLASSLNPSGFKDSVNFTASLTPLATGNITFQTNSTSYATNTISSGTASSGSTSLLPRGNNTITAYYLGDGNVLGSTNNIIQTVTNHPPTGTAISAQRTAGLKLRLFWSAETNIVLSDVDGDTVNIGSINLISTNGVTVSTNGYQILYPASAPNVNDELTYSISDGQGGTNIGVINIVVNPFTTGQQSAALSVSGGSISTKFYGIPGYVYQIQRSTNLSTGLGWVSIQTNTVDTSGAIDVTDSFGDLSGQLPASAYYRLKWQP